MGRRYKDNSLRDPETGKWDAAEIRHRLKGATAVLVSIAVLATGGWFVAGKVKDAWIAYRTTEDYLGAEGVEDIAIVVPQGASITQVGTLLEEIGRAHV